MLGVRRDGEYVNQKFKFALATNKNIKPEEDCKLLSWNVNGLLSPNSNREDDLYRLKKEMAEYDIICLQDVRIKKDELRDVRRNLIGRDFIYDDPIKKV